MTIIAIDGKIMVTAINIMLNGWLNIVKNLAINVKGWGFEKAFLECSFVKFFS